MAPIFSELAHWWAGELRAFLPAHLRGWLQRRARLTIELGGEMDAAAVRAACVGRTSGVALRLPVARVLRRTVTLPLAAERNLGAVLAFEMDRYTPFQPRDVYYDYEVEGRDAGRRTLQVLLTLVRREDVDPVLQLIRACGLEPSVLEVAGSARLDLLRTSRAGKSTPGRWQARALATLACLLLVVALALPFARKISEARHLEREIEALRADALAVEKMYAELARAAREDQELLDRRHRPAALAVLHRLTQVLPDRTWVTHLDLAGARLRVRGESPNASEIATLLEDSGLFVGAAFDGQVTREPGGDIERFAISTAVRPGSGP